MAKRKTTRKKATRAASIRSYSRSKPRRRTNKMNAATKKKLAGLGMAAGIATVAAPIAIQCITSKSVQPISNAANVQTIKDAAMRGAGGYAIGYAAGLVADKTGLKKPVNKILKIVRVI